MENSTSVNLESLPIQERESSRDKLFEDINEWFKIYYSMFLIVTGTVLNILSILTLSRKSFRHSTTSVYLRFLAVVDLFVLYNGLSRHFISGAFHYNIRHVSEAFCKFNQWSTSFGPDISAWILVAVTGERVLSMVKPHSVRLMCTKFTARVTILAIVITIVATNLPLVLFYGNLEVFDKSTNSSKTIKCTLVRSARFIDEIWYWLDLAKFILLPSALLTSSNVIIVSAIARRHRNLSTTLNVMGVSVSSSMDRLAVSGPPTRHQRGASEKESHPRSVHNVASKHITLVTSSSLATMRSPNAATGEDSTVCSKFGIRQSEMICTSSGALNTSRTTGSKSGANSNRSRNATSSGSLTITLVVVNAMFLVCNTPVMVFLLKRDGWFGPDQGAAQSLTWTVVVMAMYTNNALNFLFYCATGSRFRAEMRAMFASCCHGSVNTSRGLDRRSRFSQASESSDVSTLSTPASVLRGVPTSVKTSPHPLR